MLNQDNETNLQNENNEWQELYEGFSDSKNVEFTKTQSITLNEQTNQAGISELNFDNLVSKDKIPLSEMSKKIKKRLKDPFLANLKEKILKLIESRVQAIDFTLRFMSKYPISSRNTNIEFEKTLSNRCAIDPRFKAQFYLKTKKQKMDMF